MKKNVDVLNLNFQKEEKMNKDLDKFWKDQEEKAQQFKLKAEDIHNLYDLFYMTNWMDYETVQLNKMKGWFNKFFNKLDKFCIVEKGETESKSK